MDGNVPANGAAKALEARLNDPQTVEALTGRRVIEKVKCHPLDGGWHLEEENHTKPYSTPDSKETIWF